MAELSAAHSAPGAVEIASAGTASCDPAGFWDPPSKAAVQRAARTSFSLAVFGWGPVVLSAIFALSLAKLGTLGFDFKIDFWQPGHELLAGHSPYASQRAAIERFGSAAYPPPILLAAAPLSLLPFAIAAAVWAALLVAAAFLAVWILGVRDWRCYGLLLVSMPLFDGVTLGNVTPLLLLSVALAWRFRNSVVGAAAAVASAVVVKIFLWPLLVWLVATRRWRAAIAAAVIAAATVIAGWSALGFAGLETYPLLLRRLSDVWAPHGVSPYAAWMSLGLQSAAATIASVVVGGGLLGLALGLARRREGDRRALAAAIAAAIALSPIVWPHYLLLAFVPIALTQQRLGWLWGVPLATWPIFFLHPPPAAEGRPAVVPAAIWQTLHTPVSPVRIATCLIPFATVIAAAVLIRTREPRLGAVA
jgi:alpha-1,2-mannosyltransferase